MMMIVVDNIVSPLWLPASAGVLVPGYWQTSQVFQTRYPPLRMLHTSRQLTHRAGGGLKGDFIIWYTMILKVTVNYNKMISKMNK